MKRPASVRPGATIGVFAPSSPFREDRFEAGLEVLRRLGFRVHLHPQVHARAGYLAGSDLARTGALHELLVDETIDVVMAARGGYGVHRLLPTLDARVFARAEKPLVGFSDVTALHAFAQRHAGLTSIHGPVVTQLGDLGEADHQALVDVLGGARLTYAADGPAIARGRATGRLCGGCLSVVVPLIGTEFLDVPAGGVLLLEDVGEVPYRIDRMLTHLHLAGVLGRVGAVALGDFIGCNPPREGEPTVEEVLAERLGALGIPVLAGLPFGHGRRNLAVPLGATVTLDAEAGTLTVED